MRTRESGLAEVEAPTVRVPLKERLLLPVNHRLLLWLVEEAAALLHGLAYGARAMERQEVLYGDQVPAKLPPPLPEVGF